MAAAWPSIVHHASLLKHEGDAYLAELSCRCPKAPSAQHGVTVTVTMLILRAMSRERHAHILFCHAAIGCSAAEHTVNHGASLGEDPHQRGEVSWVD